MGLAAVGIGLAGNALLGLAVLAGALAISLTLLIAAMLAHPLAACLFLMLCAAALTK